MRCARRLLAAVVFLAGCAELQVRRAVPAAAISATHERRLHSFLLGVVPGRPLPPASELCPGGRVESVAFRMSGTDVLLATVTVGIYVPHRVEIRCSNMIGARD